MRKETSYHAEVILDDHDVTNIVLAVKTTSSVGHDQQLDTQVAHDANRENHGLHGVT